MPHGVLFRGGAEGEIRKRIIEDDLVDTVIGLGPNLFYGTGIPAAILILRAKGSKPPERQGRMLFINADREYTEGRAQNYLRPQHEQKIVATYRAFADVDGFAKVVDLTELKENDFNCNIRRYADNAPPPEPQDVRAHINGGVPIAEIEAATALLAEGGIDPGALFTARGGDYADWNHDVHSTHGRGTARDAIRSAAQAKNLGNGLAKWWHEAARPALLSLPETRSLVGLRHHFVETFVHDLQPEGIDQYAAAGMAATWWQDSVFDLTAAASHGWRAVVESWLTTAEASQDDKNPPDLASQIGVRLLAGDMLEDRLGLVAEAARLEAEVKAADSGDEEDEAKDDSEEAISPAELRRLKAERAKAKRDLKAIDAGLLASARTTFNGLTDDEAVELAIAELHRRIQRNVDEHYTNVERRLTTWYDNLIDKYAVTLRQLDAEREEAVTRLATYMSELGYG